MKMRLASALIARLICLLLLSIAMRAQVSTEVLGAHDLSPRGSSPVTGSVSASCLYCHAPHSGVGGLTPLWNQTLSTQTYTPYGSTTYNQKGNPTPPLGQHSSLCLSCHDGTVAPGMTVAYGKMGMTGSMQALDVFGTNLQGSHPFSLQLPIKDATNLVASLASAGKTGDPTGKVQLVGGNIECTTCHNPHIQSVDKVSPNFLVTDGSNGQLCLACHDPNRITNGQSNPLANWSTSAHATAANSVSTQPAVGSYHSVAQNACISCHMPHNAPGAARLLRGPNEQACISCHAGGTNVSPPAPNVFAEFSKIAHPFPAGNNTHDATETAVLNQNRHATCVDCHNPHASKPVASFPIPPVIRASQTGIEGVSATDGITVLNPAINQFENCLRCHGTSTGKAVNPIYGYLPTPTVSSGDPLNVIAQFGVSATSSHPVLHDRNSPFSQPSLRPNMLNLDGITPGRQMGVRILCTDCHNSDDNREFGGLGPNGPHGSKYWHLLERRYELSQAPGAGQAITNLFPTPDLSVAGPYGMCAKCHDLNQVMGNTSFSEHSHHINDGFSCSVCHNGHGVGAQSGNISGERLVNFDAAVVAPNNGKPISYNRATNTCTLVCHGQTH
jgi:predicted CXXCH cytochrome family protein